MGLNMREYSQQFLEVVTFQAEAHLIDGKEFRF
jgi:hypothetical protein